MSVQIGSCSTAAFAARSLRCFVPMNATYMVSLSVASIYLHISSFSLHLIQCTQVDAHDEYFKTDDICQPQAQGNPRMHPSIVLLV